MGTARGRGQRAGDEIGDGEFFRGDLVIDLRAELEQLVHDDIDADVKVRDRLLGLNEAAGDGLPHIGEGDGLGFELGDSDRGGGGSAVGFRGRRGGLGGAARGVEDIPLDDATVRAGAADIGEVDATFVRDLAGERRDPDAAVVEDFRFGAFLVVFDGDGSFSGRRRGRGGGCRRSGAGGDGGFLFRRAFSSGLGRGGLGGDGSAGFHVLGNLFGIFAGLGEDDDESPDRRLSAFGNHDFGDSARVKGFEFLGRLVGFDFGDHVARIDLVALFFEPFGESRFGHGVGELGHRDFDGHSGSFNAGDVLHEGDSLVGSGA